MKAVCAIAIIVVMACAMVTEARSPMGPVGPNVRFCSTEDAVFQDPRNYPNCPVTREYNPVCGTDGLCYPNAMALKCAKKALLASQNEVTGEVVH